MCQCECSKRSPAYWDGRPYSSYYPKLTEHDAKQILISSAIVSLVLFASTFGGIVYISHLIAG